MSWSKKHNQCINCNSNYYDHKAKGLCSKCYRVKNDIRRMNNSFGDDLHYFIYKYISVRDITQFKKKEITEQKTLLTKIIEATRLDLLKLYGSIQNDLIILDTLTMERIFNDVAFRAGKGQRFFTQDLLFIETRFKEEQRKIIALKLLKLLI